jgi:hypothetical protein
VNQAALIVRILKYEWAIVGNSVNVEALELYTKDTDSRGRVYLGTEYANKRVTVAVVEVDASGPDEAELAAAYRDAAGNADRLAREWDETSNEAWAELDG